MRHKNLFLLLLAVGSLGGCRSAEAERADLARTLTRQCLDGLAQTRAEQSLKLPDGIDSDRICGCAMKKSIEGKDVQQLRALVADGPGPAELEARGACVVEEARRAGLVG